MPIRILLHEGNWWVCVIDRWIGYYLASLFSTDVADPTQTLAQGSDQVNWHGEVYQTDETLTTTDMGSGEWRVAVDEIYSFSIYQEYYLYRC
jgi:hypothetical protein